jgi:signal transduction histidine kinase
LRDNENKPIAWLEINTDISARKRAEQAARSLSSRILALQDEERRRIARELHDSFGQYLTFLKINLDLLQGNTTFPEGQTANAGRLSECIEIVNRCLVETRTLSHLLHPPLLDEAGFTSAATWYVEGFAKRSGLTVKCDIPSSLPRLRSNAELGLFRVLQESLTNVHRHSNCSEASVTVHAGAGHMTLAVSDNGSGISAQRLRELRESGPGIGIGLAGMQERIRDLGGNLTFDSDSSGTVVTARMPIPLIAAESDDQPESRAISRSAA